MMDDIFVSFLYLIGIIVLTVIIILYFAGSLKTRLGIIMVLIYYIWFLFYLCFSNIWMEISLYFAKKEYNSLFDDLFLLFSEIYLAVFFIKKLKEDIRTD